MDELGMSGRQNLSILEKIKADTYRPDDGFLLSEYAYGLLLKLINYGCPMLGNHEPDLPGSTKSKIRKEQ